MALPALLALLALAPPQASALVVSGHFAGIANDAQFEFGLPPLATFNDAPVTGTFRLDTDQVGQPDIVDPGFVAYRLPVGALVLSFTVLGHSYHYGNNTVDSAATLAADPSGQGLMFGADFFGSLAQSASLSLGGAPGTFFDDLDLRTFHPGPVDLSLVDAYFRLAPDVGARVQVLQLSFDEVAAVSAPGTLLLTVAGLLAGLRMTTRAGGAHRGRSPRGCGGA